MRKYLYYLILVLTIINLTSCRNPKIAQEFGLQDSIPDEYLVVPNAPLVVPPIFRVEDPRYVKKTDYEKKVHKVNSDKVSNSAIMLLDRADANKDFKNIRELVDNDHKSKIKEKNDVNFINKIIPKLDPNKKKYQEKLNPIEEHKRLKSNKSINNNISEDDVY